MCFHKPRIMLGFGVSLLFDAVSKRNRSLNLASGRVIFSDLASDTFVIRNEDEDEEPRSSLIETKATEVSFSGYYSKRRRRKFRLVAAIRSEDEATEAYFTLPHSAPRVSRDHNNRHVFVGGNLCDYQ